MKGVFIEEVKPSSIAWEVGLEPGDRLLEVNGHPVRDVLDFRFHASSEDSLLLLVEKAGGEQWEVEIEKDPWEDLGLVLEGIKPRRCGCKCVFCFMDQMPPGLRPSLYYKDDDYRLSFLHGNYITLTNLTEGDWKRIEEQRLSPLYVSVHATHPRVRAFMMGSPRAAFILRDLERLVSLNVQVHTQVVLCPGINDGEILKKTLEDLLALYPGVASVALVPVGLTRYRDGLYPLEPVDREYALRVVERGHSFREEANSRVGNPFLYLADEWYLAAGLPLPSVDYYGDFVQMEDGVGMVSLFMDEWKKAVPGEAMDLGSSLILVTGKAFAPFLEECITHSPWREWVKVLPVKNEFFGPLVTVAGLITAGDILKALEGAPPGDVVVPGVMLNQEERFIDDLTPQDLARLSKRKVRVVDPYPSSLIQELSLLSRSGSRSAI